MKKKEKEKRRETRVRQEESLSERVTSSALELRQKNPVAGLNGPEEDLGSLLLPCMQPKQ